MTLLARVMRIESVTWSNPKQRGWLARLRGEVLGDTAEAYSRLEAALKPYDITPLFRPGRNGARHEVLLVPGVLRVKPSRVVWNAVLFVLTVLSVFAAGVSYAYQGPSDFHGPAALPALRQALKGGGAFTVSLLAILLAHEFGHYLAARYHGTAVSLPYFLPFPFSLFGTLGAFISLKAPPRNKRVLLDIGIAGPLAGMAVALPVLFIGLMLSRIEPLPTWLPQGSLMLEGNSILYLLSKWVIFGRLLPAPPTYGNTAPLLYWLKFFFTGQPLPLGGQDVILHPMAWAGWAGFLVTALNLIPLGTLDGGHVLYALLGDRSRRLFWPLLGVLGVLGLVWDGWWLWAFLLLFLGRRYAEPLDQITPLDGRRRALGMLALVLLLIVFTPVPLEVIAFR